MAAELRMDL